ncbi:hypothetical protein L1887_33410 [Cichorium endivia]|nr:hypothetical protein L1887_33410 [Cichorium endivia]
MAFVKIDVGGNITLNLRNHTVWLGWRLQLRKQMVHPVALAVCCGLLAMHFIVELFCNLMEHKSWSMSQVCSEAYTKTEEIPWLM